MAWDRLGNLIKVGDKVKTIPKMGLQKNKSATGFIKSIDGEYILVYVPHVLRGTDIERYACELEKVNG